MEIATKNVQPFRFKRLGTSLEELNWIKGTIFLKTDNGNVPMDISHRHIHWWMKEFNLTMQEIEDNLY